MKDSIYNKAQKAFTILLELNPDHYKARYNRGVLYAMQANILFALSDFNNLIRNQKLLKNAYYNRGIVYQHMNNYSGGIHDFSKAIDLGLKNENIYIKRAECYLANKQNNEACKDFVQLTKIDEQIGKQYLVKYCDQYKL
jgi:tetratricopeptide (TPR) repeat protein